MYRETTPKEREVEFQSYDGVQLQGTYTSNQNDECGRIVLLLHGIGGDRNEHGLFQRISFALANNGRSSFRFDWRCHGCDSHRSVAELTLSGVYNDIESAANTIIDSRTSSKRERKIDLIAFSFTGALALHWAFRNSQIVNRVVLLSPVLDYVDEYLSGEQYVNQGILSNDASGQLQRHGILKSQSRLLSRQMCNEMRAFPPADLVDSIDYWIIHGDQDQSVSLSTSVRFFKLMKSTKLLVIPGANHSFTEYERAESDGIDFQSNVATEISDIIIEGRDTSTYPKYDR